MSEQALRTGLEAAIARLHAAMGKVANGDTSGIKALYTHSDDATSFYGWGGYEKGWEAVSQRWDWAGQQFKGGTVSYRNLTSVATAELAYTTDIETFCVCMDGVAQPVQWSNRVTHIFRFEGEWRLVHRHANRLEKRYEPSPGLKKLQEQD
ncbi:MAG: nuclear transport factor 2 family protein [Hyphomicrobiaceae bacterium]|nr:nuclear transport factor 2 family protein [Hyphomicrobiaceae bacterium]